MPQEFQVLQCFKCSTFQVHQVKKSNKWNCKLCGEKQSVKKVFGRGSGSDCRCHVQKLNTLRGEIDAEREIREAEKSITAQEEEEGYFQNDSQHRTGEVCYQFYLCTCTLCFDLYWRMLNSGRIFKIEFFVIHVCLVQALKLVGNTRQMRVEFGNCE
ncbi:hypothetical protein FSP39_009358 [Pinctada imbricata]|uniref:MRN complex-interacting protein N-terminal domain-containing protein n=1 Tax=Pinctada imbricata TaxID=66713 RepID=A0AA89BQU3_PINIB|nr:hypothetical protein FSP39_009358 [Pinctada imbricata]